MSSCSVSRALVCLCLALATIGCGGAGETSRRAAEPVRVTAATSGDALWKRLPAGADLILELDLARLRSNPVVGPLLEVMAPPESMREVDLLDKAETMLLAVYEMGNSPRQLIILEGESLPAQAMPSLGPHVLALGDSELVRRAEGLQESSPTMADDDELWRLRSTSMPEKADAAALRVTARLGFDVRVQIASRLAISDVPVSMTLWLDVVDDLAMIADLQSEDAGGAERLDRALVGLGSRLATMPFLRFAAISPALRNLRVTRSGSLVRLVFVLSPQRLRLVVDRLFKQLDASTQNEPPAAAL